MVFLASNSYTPESDATIPFSNVIFGDLVEADVGYPLLENGEPVQNIYVDRMTDEVFENELPLPTSTMLSERYCATNQASYTGSVELTDGTVVDVSDYDVVFVSFLWMYYGYIQYLNQAYPKLSLVGIQEESVRDVTACSAQLQTLHHETLRVLDAVIAINEQYRTWVSPYTDHVLLQPLPIPDGQFDDVKLYTDNRTVCVGVGTANMDFSNIYSNLLVVDKLRDSGYDIDAEIIGLKGYQRERFDKFTNKFNFLSLTGYIQDGYYDYLARTDLAVLLTTRGTTGRPASEFAAIGVPCIGTSCNAHQRECFPDLCVDPFDSEQAVTLAEKLLTDQGFRRRTLQAARTGLERLQSKESPRKVLHQLLDHVT